MHVLPQMRQCRLACIFGSFNARLSLCRNHMSNFDQTPGNHSSFAENINLLELRVRSLYVSSSLEDVHEFI